MFSHHWRAPPINNRRLTEPGERSRIRERAAQFRMFEDLPILRDSSCGLSRTSLTVAIGAINTPRASES